MDATPTQTLKNIQINLDISKPIKSRRLGFQRSASLVRESATPTL